MHLDVLELRNFYYRTGIGRAAQRAVRDQVVAFWPPVKGQTVVGFGFAVPLLRPYLASARRVICLMPGQQGVMAWPVGQPNVSVLCAEAQWPVATGSVDRLVIVHGLETSEHPAAMLEESQRVLAPGGKALFIVPNRSGLWARRDGTPFGFGRPFSLGQIESQLRDHGFTPERHVAALFAPPSNRRFWLRTAPMWERVGRRLSTRFAGGVLMVEAGKEVPARPRPGLGAAVRRPLRVLDGLPMPDPKPT
ncbi:SAM-dependent methyltransferase [Rhodobacteraceae bacterium MBR-64]|jgi:SAM-dependent methyltransferase